MVRSVTTKIVRRMIVGTRNPPITIQRLSDGASYGACSASVPRLRAATQKMSAHITTVTAENVMRMNQPRRAMLAAWGPPGAIIGWTPRQAAS